MTKYKYTKAALEKGTKVEMEHTTNPFIAKKIAKDHLKENPKYYDYSGKGNEYLISDKNKTKYCAKKGKFLEDDEFEQERSNPIGLYPELE